MIMSKTTFNDISLKLKMIIIYGRNWFIVKYNLQIFDIKIGHVEESI